MRKKYIFGKKLYISILTMIVVLLTTVATTFAWVGVFANSTFDTFEFSIKSNELKEYGIEVSLTGEEGSFTDSISSDEIKKQILLNWGYTQEELNYMNINKQFASLVMIQCTTLPTVSGGKLVSLNDFTDIEGKVTKDYFAFDVYVSASRFYQSDDISNYKLDVFLDKGLISGTNNYRMLVNPFTYPDGFVNPLGSAGLPNNFDTMFASRQIKNAVINSKNACRVAFEKFEVIDKFHPEQYSSTSKPLSAVIYTGDDYEYPVYNNSENLYDFGAILDDDLNLAVGYYNSTEYLYSSAGIKTVSISDSTASVYAGDIFTIRGVNGTNPDKLFNSHTNHLIDSTNPNEQVGIDKMMKVRISMWFEGWDADCFPAISNSPITLSVSMSIINENEF